MNPRVRTTLGAVAASLAAAYVGWLIADGSYALPSLLAVVIVSLILMRATRLPLDVIVLGFLLIGYIDGNRGFAQLMPYPGIPLLPAEIGLAIAAGWRALRCAFERRLPFRNGPLNWIVLAWLVAGTARVVFDVPRFGILALRDYAVVYYAVFFFLAQDMGRDPRARRYLSGCLLFAALLLLPLFLLTQLFPDFFLTRLTFRGNPLIFYKGDLLTTLLGIGSLLLFLRTGVRHRLAARSLSGVFFLLVAAGDNRASLLAIGVAGLLLLLARRWQYPVLQGSVAAAGLLVVLLLAQVFGNSWAERKLDGVTERISSLVDFTGSGRYTSESSNKGDNNRFRLVWWRNVAEETWDKNPVMGLGFGSDLARGFLEEYFPEGSEDFSARSPHSIFLTAFGRMGLVGLAIWLIFCVTLLRRTWRSLRHTEDPADWSLWCGAWVILVSASLGVVLESPMGAVLFWSFLGLGNASLFAAADEPAAAEGEPSPAETAPAAIAR